MGAAFACQWNVKSLQGNKTLYFLPALPCECCTCGPSCNTMADIGVQKQPVSKNVTEPIGEVSMNYWYRDVTTCLKLFRLP
jgi:hypothetical protein